MTFRTERKREILRRRHRKIKVAKLKAKLEAASSKAEKEKIIAKLRHLRPFVDVPTN